MEKTSVDTNDVAEDMDVAALDKECSALSALFQQIINEMKVCDIIFKLSRILKQDNVDPIIIFFFIKFQSFLGIHN